ncbi:MAG: CPBP family intramembrane glutamic endopeptidase [Myxococcota bacterium]|nr:CPBP family intramembrane glutamic endopeptidase [Myxococcota bacterium]
MLLGPRGAVTVLGALGLLFVVVAVTLGALSLSAGLTALFSGAAFGQALDETWVQPVVVQLSLLTGLLVATGLGTAAAWGRELTYREALDINPVPAAIIVLAIVGGLALQFPLRELVNLIVDLAGGAAMSLDQQLLLQQAVRIDSIADALLVPLTIVAAPAIGEELLFRGLLLPGLSYRYGDRVGLVLSAALFALIHGAPALIAMVFVAGLVLGVIRQRTGSILPCVAMHGAFNAVPVLLPASVVRIEGFNTVGADVYHLPLGLALGGALVAAASVMAIARLSGERD